MSGTNFELHFAYFRFRIRFAIHTMRFAWRKMQSHKITSTLLSTINVVTQLRFWQMHFECIFDSFNFATDGPTHFKNIYIENFLIVHKVLAVGLIFQYGIELK